MATMLVIELHENVPMSSFPADRHPAVLSLLAVALLLLAAACGAGLLPVPDLVGGAVAGLCTVGAGALGWAISRER